MLVILAFLYYSLISVDANIKLMRMRTKYMTACCLGMASLYGWLKKAGKERTPLLPSTKDSSISAANDSVQQVSKEK